MDFNGEITKTLIIDLSNICHRMAHIIVAKNPDDNKVWSLWSRSIIYDMLEYVNKFSPDKVVIAIDSKPTWRKEIYPEYKAHRKLVKGKVTVDKESLENFIYEQFVPVLSSRLFPNFKWVKVDGAEADDIIACYTYNFYKSESITLVSSDKDFHQLQKFYGFKQWCPLKKKFVESLNPERELAIKVVVGDPGDNIKPIKPGIGEKTAEKMINEGVDVENGSDAVMVKNFKMNKLLIDFEFIPKCIYDSIISCVESIECISFSNKTAFSMLSHDSMLASKLQIVKDKLSKVK